MENIDVVRKLLGRIEPVADSAIDKERLVNLESTIDLVQDLLFDISFVAREKDSPYASAKKIGETADKFLKQIREEW